MWPMLLDYSTDESKRILRRLELGAYASIVSVFRAQGDLSKDKKKILQDLQQALSISTERHRAEVRRAVNDEKLSTIADSVVGNIATSEWMVEGRRLVPLMPRLVPQTNFTATANQAASAMVEKNTSLPPPSQTCNKNDSSALAAMAKLPRPVSPSSNVVVLPSGTSIHIKGMLNKEDDDDIGLPAAPQRLGARSLSTDSQNACNMSTQTPRVSYSSTSSSSVPSSSPVKITISKSPQGRPVNVSTGSQPPKVILVTSASGTQGTPVIQRSTSVPVVRSMPTTASTYTGPGLLRNPVSVPEVVRSVSSVGTSSYPGIVTSTTVTGSVSIPVPSSSATSSGVSSNLFNPSVQIGLGKVRPRIVPRQRYPGVVPGHKSGVVLPMGGPQLISPGAQGPVPTTVGPQVASSHQPSPSGPSQVVHHHTTSGGIQVKTLNKPTIQIKQEGGMKIITQGAANKILPKPSQMQGGAGSSSPVVMVNTGPTANTTSAVTMLPRTISTYTAHSGGKVLNITTPGGRVIATTTKASNMVTVNPKTLHLTAVKSGSGSTTVSKPNVIVVQKTQHPRLQSPLVHGSAHIRSVSTSSFPGAIDKDVLGSSSGRHVVTAGPPPGGQSTATGGPSLGGRPGERRVIITTSGAGGETTKPVSIIHRNRNDGDGKTSCLLTELIQAARQLPSDPPPENRGSSSFYEIEGSENFLSTAVLTSLASLSSSSSSSTTTPSTTFSSSTFTQSNPISHSLPLQQQQPPLHHRPLLQQQQQQVLAPPFPLPPSSQQFKLLEEGRGEVIGTARNRRMKSENDSDGDQVISVEQAMSLLNREVVDLTELDTPTIVSSMEHSASTTVSVVNIPSTSAHVTTVIPGPIQQQPKVSILGVSQKVAGGKVFATNLHHVDKIKDRVKPPASPPVEVPREGHLDTQTGIFYPVIPSSSSSSLSTSVGSTISSTMTTSLPPSTMKIIDIASDENYIRPQQQEKQAHFSSTSHPFLSASPSLSSSSSSSSSTSSLSFPHKSVPTTGLSPYSPPLQVVQQQLPSPLPPSTISPSASSLTLPKSSSVIISSSLSSSSSSILLSSSLSSSSLPLSSTTTTTTTTTIKPSMKSISAPPLDIISSSLAHAGLNLDTFVHDNEESEEFDEGLALTLEDDGEEEDEDIEDGVNEEDEDDLGGVEELGKSEEQDDQIESALSSSGGSGSAPRPGMAEVIKEETAKDGTRILTVSNPASSQLDHSPPLTFLNGQQQMVSLPSHSIRQAPSPHLGGITASAPSRVVSPYSTSATPLVEASKTEKLVSGPSPPTITVHQHLPKPTNSATIPNVNVSDQPTSVGEPSFLPVAVPIDKTSPRVITLRLDDLSTSHKLDVPMANQKQNSAVEEIKHPIPESSLKHSVEMTVVAPPIQEKTSETLASYPISSKDSTEVKSVLKPTTPLSVTLPLPLATVVLTPVTTTTAAGTTTTVVVGTADQTSPIRSSKRKRKHPSDGGDSTLLGGAGGWIKLASTLLMKVCQFKGSPRDKTDIPAAEWFTFPVDPLDAPDYYTVVHNPIDFSTMKRKLKEGQYSSFEDFDSDMELVRSNCYLYNSEGTKVRRDCEEVMAYYQSELNKMLERQSKDNVTVNVSSSPLKRNRVEEKGFNHP